MPDGAGAVVREADGEDVVVVAAAGPTPSGNGKGRGWRPSDSNS